MDATSEEMMLILHGKKLKTLVTKRNESMILFYIYFYKIIISIIFL
jgi:hypothetical protein